MKDDKRLLILSVLIYVLLTIPQLSEKIITDEAIFFRAAEGISKTGIPAYYFGESIGIMPYIAHPPLYYTALGAFMFLFGATDLVTRLFSVLINIITVALTFLIAKNLLKNDKTAFLATLLLILTPLYLQGSMILDIDNTVLILFSTAFLYLFIKTYQNPHILHLGIIFSLILFSKLNLIFIIPFSIFLFYAIEKKFRYGISTAIKIASIGILLFLVLWAAYSMITGINFLMPFEHDIKAILTYNNIGQQSSLFIRVLTYLWYFKIFVFWTIPALMLLYVISSFEKIRNILKHKRLEPVLFLIIFSLLVIVQNFIQKGAPYGFPKYYIIAIPAIVIIVISSITTELKKFINMKFAIIALLILGYYLIIGDPYLTDTQFIEKTTAYGKLASETIKISLELIIPIIGLFIYSILTEKGYFLESFKVYLLIIILTSAAYITIIQLQAPYSTTYNYGEMGFTEAAQYICQSSSPNETLYLQRDIQIYCQRKFYASYQIGVPLSTQFMTDTKLLSDMKSDKIRWVVLRNNELMAINSAIPEPDFLSILKSKYSLNKTFGNFLIYKLSN